MARTQFARAIEAPEPPYSCEVTAFPVAVVPFALRALEARTVRSVWSAASYKRGVQLIRSMQVALLTGCMDELLARGDRLYMLLDSALYGREYSASNDEPPIYSPAIPPAPNSTPELPGLIARTHKLEKLLDNAINGTSYAEYGSSTSIRVEIVRIREILEAGGGDELDPEMLAELVKIVALLA